MVVIVDRVRPAAAWRRACGPALALLLAAGAQAQEVPTPGSVRQSLSLEQPAFPSLSTQIVFPEQPAPSPFDRDERRFSVFAFDIQGASVFPVYDLKRQVDRFVDMELNLYDLNRVAEEITYFYHRRGYTLARAYVPAQTVVDGVVRIEVVEGRLGSLRIRGNRRASEDFLRNRLATLQPGVVLTNQLIEDRLLRLNELPGLSSRIVLSPGEGFGTSDAELQVDEQLFSGGLNYGNSGRKETGQNRLQGNLALNAPFGLGDRLTLSGITTDQQLIKYWSAAYELPLGSEGVRLRGNASRLEYGVAGSLASLGVGGVTRTVGGELVLPIKRTRDDSRSLTLGYRLNRSTQESLDTVLAEHRLRLYSLAYSGTLVHRNSAVSHFALRVDSNFRRNPEGTEQDRVRARGELDFNHLSPYLGKWDFYIRGNAVYSRETLPDAEKFSLGGPTSVRAFRPSEVRGDSGGLVTIELRRPFSVLGVSSQARLTGDWGWVDYKFPGYRTTSDRLGSLGVGASVFPARGITASVDLAAAVGSSHAASDGDKIRLWVSVGGNF